MIPASLTPTELANALLDGCEHHRLDWGKEAAVHLLIAEGSWLRRTPFHRQVQTGYDSSSRLIAWVDWAALAAVPERSPASSGELALLRLACHLAGAVPDTCDNRWCLAELLRPLDAANALRASRAVALAALGPSTVGPLE